MPPCFSNWVDSHPFNVSQLRACFDSDYDISSSLLSFNMKIMSYYIYVQIYVFSLGLFESFISVTFSPVTLFPVTFFP